MKRKYHNGEYGERCNKQDGDVRDFISMEKSRMHNEGKSFRLSIMSG